MAKIISIDKGSPAYKSSILVGDELVSINNNKINDLLDYMYYSNNSKLTLCLLSNGIEKTVKIFKDEYEDLGLNFDNYLLDKEKSCKNKCVFCFIDQLPKGMRSSLYYKDDDVRLSLLTGNYVTLTNLSEQDIQRIIKLKISPINISVHTTDGELRVKMMKNPNAAKIMPILKSFNEAKINMRCQLVICKGLNDGEALKKSLADLYELYPQVSSVAVVPVGLTCHRTELYPLEPILKEDALEIIKTAEEFSKKALKEKGTRFCYCADEMYIKAELDIPDNEYYEEYEQLENGVGLLRQFEQEFHYEFEEMEALKKDVRFSVATGTSAAPFLKSLLDEARKKWHNLEYEIYAIENDFFGRSVNVAGLLTGQDILKQLKGKKLYETLLISSAMLRHGTNTFLDDYTIPQLEKELNVKIIPVDCDGGTFIDLIYEMGGNTVG
ncbi:MAG: DUF512 domain-containing protein [Ruminococcaceae bacterium]|nr:DUF512 domain-containing protein [Oscillospiraceae bacterium]